MEVDTPAPEPQNQQLAAAAAARRERQETQDLLAEVRLAGPATTTGRRKRVSWSL
jgi:hypothetical protein